MTYQFIVNVSNQIRFILNTSRQVTLAAQNASLAARRAGNVRGFQAVAVELKTFSQGLSLAMNEMANDILAIAQSISGSYKHQRMYQHKKTALKLSKESEILIHALDCAERQKDSFYEVYHSRLKLLERRLLRSQRLCNNGLALARSALIEASAGGEVEQMLTNVAHDIEHTIDDIYARLKVIESCLQGN